MRHWVIAGILALVGLGVSAPAAQAACDGPYQFPVEDLENPNMRDLLLTTQDELERFFNLELNGFCLDDEEWGAYYTIDTNTLALGIEFFLEAANPPGNINSAVAILAHEVAHAFQNKHHLLGQLVDTNLHRVKCIELHADFLAGGYMGWRSRTYNIERQNLTALFYSLGDDAVTQDGHHGRAAERFLSFHRGFDTVTEDEITLSSMGFAYVSQANCNE